MSAIEQGTNAVTGRAHCQRQVAFFSEFSNFGILHPHMMEICDSMGVKDPEVGRFKKSF